MYTFEMIKTARKVVEEVVEINSNNKVLVISDELSFNIGKIITIACRYIGAETILMIVPLAKQHGNEPSYVTSQSMLASDYIFTTTTYSITHTDARVNAYKAGAKTISLRGVDEDMMIEGAMSVNFNHLKKKTAKLAEVLSQGNKVKVSSSLGTNITFSIKNREGFSIDGFYRDHVGFAVLPPGEAPVGPVEGTANGEIVFDYSIDNIGKLSSPVKVVVQDGLIVSVEGGEEAEKLKSIVNKHKNANNLAEFAIGTNPNSRLIGNLAEDKKLAGTVHFGIGDNIAFGGGVKSSIHLDGLILKPTVYIDEMIIVQDGTLNKEYSF